MKLGGFEGALGEMVGWNGSEKLIGAILPGLVDKYVDVPLPARAPS